ncbi:MAG: hypothetical protein IKZ02_04535 [Alphaproteobacteria bacterium]|nr:hypothetical protein [Alphaproteobacteria bacterium]MBR4932275.1 hypothetical protein [Alphaproteobacteria bacterium]
MGNIKFYTIEDWVGAYLKEWGYTEDALIVETVARLREEKHNLHPDDIVQLLNEQLLDYLDSILPETTLTGIQKLSYFKMIFLHQKLFEKYNLFRQISAEEEKELIACFQQQLFQPVPDLIEADMFRQSIKTFHPFWKIKKTFVKGIKLFTKSKKESNA